MADAGKLVKMEVDYSDTVDKKLPECQEMAKVCQKGALLCSSKWARACGGGVDGLHLE